MKVEIEANALVNGDIKKLSLVEHGAIRQPFKILKTEEIASTKGGVRNTINKIFGQVPDEQQIAALFVRKDVARRVIPMIKEHGFRVEKEHAEMMGDVLVLKQEGFDPDAELPIIALNTDVAVQLSSLSKFFDPFPASSSFSDNVAAGSFWPGMHNAMESLADTVWNVLNESDSPEAASSDVAKQIKAFSTHLNNLVAELPTTVFKMERELTKEFEGSTVSTTDNKITLDEESNMSATPVLKEVAAGDLDGLLDDAPAADAAIAATDAAIEEVVAKEDDESTETTVEKSGDEGAPKSGGSPGNPIVENTSDTGAVSLDEGGVPAGMRKEERAIKSLEDGNVVEKVQLWFVNDETKEEIFGGYVEKASEADPVIEEYSPAEVKLFEAMGVMAKSVVDLKDMVEQQNERIEAVAKTADTAQETAEETVVMSVADDLDNSLATLNGKQPVVKGAAPAAIEDGGEVVDIFKGLLPGLEGDAA